MNTVRVQETRWTMCLFKNSKRLHKRNKSRFNRLYTALNLWIYCVQIKNSQAEEWRTYSPSASLCQQVHRRPSDRKKNKICLYPPGENNLFSFILCTSVHLFNFRRFNLKQVERIEELLYLLKFYALKNTKKLLYKQIKMPSIFLEIKLYARKIHIYFLWNAISCHIFPLKNL